MLCRFAILLRLVHRDKGVGGWIYPAIPHMGTILFGVENLAVRVGNIYCTRTNMNSVDCDTFSIRSKDLGHRSSSLIA